MRVIVVLVLALCGGACTGNNRNTACEWPQHSATPLDLATGEGRSHLHDDADLAEDLAIRYADHTFGRSGANGRPDYREGRERCMANLFTVIALGHRVSLPAVRNAVGQRNTALDAIALGSFAALHLIGSMLVVRRVRRRTSGWFRSLVVIATGLAAAVVGFAAGFVWLNVFEAIHVGGGHISYRAERAPWAHHADTWFFGLLSLYCLAALLQSWRGDRRGPDTVRATAQV